MSSAIKIDLHTHSHCSDGVLTPQELVGSAAAAGIGVLALTDHDSIAGVEDAQRTAAGLNIHIVPGVEISTAWRSQSIHVLGLWIDPTCKTLCLQLNGQEELRRERMRKICARLDKLRLPGDALLGAVEAQRGIPTRSHLAHAMVSMGLVDRTDEAFRKYLAKGKPGHVSVEWPSIEAGVAWIGAAGGVAVLAHPTRYALSSGARQRLISDFKAAGGLGIEVVSGGNGAHHTEGCAALAKKYDLQGSVGSDFHSPQFAWNPLGRSLKLPDFITPVWHGRLP